jgi:DNA-binding transcriptional LysR family regulator
MKQNFTVRQGALDGVETFLAVAKQRSFRRAAAALGVTPSAVSQTVRSLEAPRRSPRRCPADPGTGDRLFLPGLSRDRIGDRCKRRDAGSCGGFDAGIRLGQSIAPDMIVVRLTPPLPFVVVGSPDYLRLRKRPERIDDLRQHACLRMRRSNGSIAPWPFVEGNKAIEAIVSGPLIAHDYPTLLGAAVQGVGLAQLPNPLAKAPIAEGRLQALLTLFAVTVPGVFLYYPGRRQVLPKLRAFIEHVKYRSADAPPDGTTARRLRKADRANST